MVTRAVVYNKGKAVRLSRDMTPYSERQRILALVSKFHCLFSIWKRELMIALNNIYWLVGASFFFYMNHMVCFDKCVVINVSSEFVLVLSSWNICLVRGKEANQTQKPTQITQTIKIHVYTFSIQKHWHQNMDNLTPPPPLIPLPNFFLG